MMAPNLLLTSENAEGWLDSDERPLKAVLFTKKSETPSLWVRVADALADQASFGEIRHTETELMKRFGMMENVLPKVIAIRCGSAGAAENILYEGPNDFDKLCEFLKDAIGGGSVVVDLRRQVETLNREVRGLRSEVAKEREAASAARAEAARIKLGQVGQVEAARNSIKVDLQQAKANEAAALQKLETESLALRESLEKAIKERDTMRAEAEALRSVHGCMNPKLPPVLRLCAL
jgi:hypothetical protein